MILKTEYNNGYGRSLTLELDFRARTALYCIRVDGPSSVLRVREADFKTACLMYEAFDHEFESII